VTEEEKVVMHDHALAHELHERLMECMSRFVGDTVGSDGRVRLNVIVQAAEMAASTTRRAAIEAGWPKEVLDAFRKAASECARSQQHRLRLDVERDVPSAAPRHDDGMS
jgi:hypothetical protein